MAVCFTNRISRQKILMKSQQLIEHVQFSVPAIILAAASHMMCAVARETCLVGTGARVFLQKEPAPWTLSTIFFLNIKIFKEKYGGGLILLAL